MTARVALLSDPNYRVTIERTAVEQEAKVRELETKIANMKKYRRQREKVLETVLETGITPEMTTQIGDLQSNIVVVARKVTEVEKRNGQIAEMFNKLSEKETELTEKIAKLEATGVSLTAETPHLKVDLTANDGLEARIKHLDNSLARKKVMVKSLENELKLMQETVSACNLKLSRLTSDLELKAVEVHNMSGVFEEKSAHRRVMSNPGRKIFMTER